MKSALHTFKTSFSDGSCARCGKPRILWSHPDGYAAAGMLYCCKSCATGYSCDCSAVSEIHTAAYSGPERRVSPQRRAWKMERRAMFLRSPN